MGFWEGKKQHVPTPKKTDQLVHRDKGILGEKKGVLVSYCCVTNYHKLRDLNKYSDLTIFVGQEYACGLVQSSAQGLTR